MKNIIKSLVGRVYRTLLPYFSSSKNLRIILMYHRVLEKQPDLYDPGMYVTTDTFAMHMEELFPFFKPVPLEELVFSREEQRLCAITFDDGWIDNYGNAFPLLKRDKIPATIFLPTAMVGTDNKFWFDLVHDAAKGAIDTSRQQEFIVFFRNIVSLEAATISRSYLQRLNEMLKKNIDPLELDSLADRSYRLFAAEKNKKRSVISWEEAREMAEYNIRFGSHCLHHHILPPLSLLQKKKEINESLDQLKKHIPAGTPFFSYPNGDWDEDTIATVAAGGYMGAVTTRLGAVNGLNKRFKLNRISMHDYISSTPSLLWFRIFQSSLYQ